MSLKLALISAAIVSAVSMPAFAGSLVTNSTTTREARGQGYTQFSSVRNSAGTQNNYSQSVKAESYAPNASTFVELKNGNLSGNAWGSTSPVNPDPIAIITNSNQRENVSFTQQDVGSGYERYNFTENGYKHEVSADSF